MPGMQGEPAFTSSVVALGAAMGSSLLASVGSVLLDPPSMLDVESAGATVIFVTGALPRTLARICGNT
jgi:hypothetical protein